MAIAAQTQNGPPLNGSSETDRRAVPPVVPDHTLLRCIGRGSYGEVWLARNTMGTYRAVKVVRRQSFEDQRPFDRELHGIEKFEPISRSHPGLMNILQVGRNEANEYFYCVMELADDSRGGEEKRGSGEKEQIPSAPLPLFSPATYVPRTLRKTANQEASLLVADCLKLGLALTDALCFLHEHGLVHRDIKPSNIIFVNGAPKLADIGLVTGLDETRSFVGTEGFIAPEGPGTPQADLYSMGKVLYELSTGKDRQEFPDLPTNIGRSPEHEELLELNEILVRACAHDPRKRYASAREMRADLALLESGRSIKHLRLVERRFAVARFVGLAAAGVAVLSTVAVLFYARQAGREHKLREQLEETLKSADKAKQSFRQEWYARSMLLAYDSVHANNFGHVRELLDETRAFATEVVPMNAARSAPPWEWRHLQYESRDEASSIVAQCAETVGSVAASPDGQWLAAGLDNGQVLLLDLSGSPLRQEWQVAQSGVECLAFSPESQRLAAGCVDGSVRVLAIPSGKLITEFQDPSGILELCFSQDGRRLAYCSTSRLSIYDILGGNHSHEVTPNNMYRVALTPHLNQISATVKPEGLLWWSGNTNVLFPDVVGNRFTDHGQAISPDGRWLAVALVDYSIEIWSVVEKQLAACRTYVHVLNPTLYDSI